VSLFYDLGMELVAKLQATDRRTPEELAYWQTHPAEWIIKHLGIARETIFWSELPEYRSCQCEGCVRRGNRGKPHLWDGDVDPLAKALNGLVTHKQVGVESGTNTGKTIILVAGAALWFADVFQGSQTITVAPKEDQLLLHGWKEIDEFWPLFERMHPQAKKDAKIIRVQHPLKKWRILAFTAGVKAEEAGRSASKAQGFHEKDQLTIFEEFPGIATPVKNAFQATSTGAHNIILGVGNPDHQQDPLHTFCLEKSTLKVRVSSLDHPNLVCRRPIVPAAVQLDGVHRMRDRWGIAPAESKDALIKLKWCYAARDNPRPLKWESAPRAWGVDVANSEHGDKGATSEFFGPVCAEVEDFPCPNANRLGDQLAQRMTSLRIDPTRVGVDIDGLGIGAWNQMKLVHPTVQGLHSGAGMVEGLIHLFDPKEVFGNLRAQMWWLAMRDLERSTVWLPDDEELFQELIAIEWFSRGGKIWMKPKDEAKAKLGHSPNKADAFVYGNWVRQVAPPKRVGAFAAVRAK
jgi:phage terminase large subunit